MRKHNESAKIKQHTKRFHRNEAAFSLALFKLLKQYRARVTVTALADEAHLSRQAFYQHHHDINAAITEIEENLLQKFIAFLDARYPKNGKPTSNRQSLEACFIFIAHNKPEFREIGNDEQLRHIIYQMLEIIYPQLQIDEYHAGTSAPELGSDRADDYLRRAESIICRWVAESQCNLDGSEEKYIRQLLQLTDELCWRNPF